jgi:hypothetical protein
VIHRPQLLLHALGQRLQRLIAGAVAQAVVELLEVVDIQQRNRQRCAVALHARALGIERLHQAATIRDLRQRIGRHFIGQVPELVFE